MHNAALPRLFIAPTQTALSCAHLRNLQKTESNAFRFLFYAIAFYELQTTSQVSMP